MSLETRNGRGAYYTRSKRIAGRIVRTYVGSGLVALEAAEEDEDIRLEEAAERARRRESDAEARMLDQLLVRYSQSVDHAIETELSGLGIKRRRSEWRKAR